LEAEIVRALGALRSLLSKKKLLAEKRRETLFLSSEKKEKWIEHQVERQTAGARQPAEARDEAIRQEQEVTETSEIWRLTTREHERLFYEMLIAIEDSLSYIATSDGGENEEYENEEETGQGKLSEDDEPGWVMCTISKMVKHRIEMLRQKQMKLAELTE
jgi:hypothetical protein